MEGRPARVAILASGDKESGGGGSTMEQFIRATQGEEINAEVSLVICNNPRGTVGIYDRVDSLNDEYGLDIEALMINSVKYPGGKQARGQTLQEAAAIYDEIVRRDIWYVLCLGYMKQLNGKLVEELGWHPKFEARDPENKGIYYARIANTHPGKLPETSDTYGIGASRRAIELGLANTAHTLHTVSAGIDKGPVIAEHLVTIKAKETPESLFDRVRSVEKANVAPAMNKYFEAQAKFLNKAT